MKNKLLIFMLAIILVTPFVFADTETYPVNQEVELKFTCTLNNAIPSALAEFNITISYPNGSTFINNQPTTALGNGAFNYTTTFTQTGLYKVQMFCYDGTYSYSGEGKYNITPNGLELTLGRAFIDLGLIALLVIFFIGNFVLFMNNNGLLVKVGTIGIGYLLLIGISFIAWNMANDFLISAPFIIAFFRIIFFVLIIGFFPLVLGGFIWYFLMLWKIKEIERLMTKGFSENEAERRMKHGRK